MAPVNILVADDGNKLTYWQPKMRSALPYTFYWHRNDTAHFENYDKAKKYVLAIIFLRNTFQNSSHAIT